MKNTEKKLHPNTKLVDGVYSSKHPLYRTWSGMRERCGNFNHKDYHSYGGRGISVCSEWDSFKQFVEDVGVRPEGHTLDRIDNDEDYCKDNCRWATHFQQAHSRRLGIHNKSGVRGVHWCKKSNKWVFQGRRFPDSIFKRFKNLEEATEFATTYYSKAVAL